MSEIFTTLENFCSDKGILYRNTVLNGEPAKQLVLPLHYHETVLKQLHDNVGHQGQYRITYLVSSIILAWI